MMPNRLVLNCGISSRRNSAMKAYDEWSNTTTSAAMPRNASSQPSRDGPGGPAGMPDAGNRGGRAEASVVGDRGGRADTSAAEDRGGASAGRSSGGRTGSGDSIPFLTCRSFSVFNGAKRKRRLRIPEARRPEPSPLLSRVPA
ncbi:hypothetical protein GCM10010251_55620 [Streptomyces aurantiogriseus]|uniref:Uncharacterized protein n=1 Tax=Streptomyces aurantiogriseus TaxID=66870 RepID=A0A918FD75_9ACTN|nr:hypothetical protein GCM10010251_55620 [Streptomyces aurantiogriseus]